MKRRRKFLVPLYDLKPVVIVDRVFDHLDKSSPEKAIVGKWPPDQKSSSEADWQVFFKSLDFKVDFRSGCKQLPTPLPHLHFLK